ncbi:MAG TPA: Na+/H+ antiporter NhaA [Actinomycetes bacterium]|nr:Na+/H+ antiporter NhaA [Actinomycetes bacterium]
MSDRQPLWEYLREEAAGGVVLMAAAAVALVWANSPWGAAYAALWEASLAFQLGRFGIEAALPVVAAVGGMAVPAAIYAAGNAGGPGAPGWGVPMATDIAFALGVLALLGSRVPAALKVFLLTLAVVDDLGSIAVVALVSSHAGVSPALAGVVVGLLVPARGTASPAERLAHRLHPVSAFVVVPLFALANVGVSIEPGVLTRLGPEPCWAGSSPGACWGSWPASPPPPGSPSASAWPCGPRGRAGPSWPGWPPWPGSG